MNCRSDLTSRRLDASDVALPFERTRDLDNEVDIHCLIPALWVVIEEQVVSRVQFAALRFQQRPHLIERRLPCSGDIAEGYRDPDRCHQAGLRSFHHNIILHEHGPPARDRRSTASAYVTTGRGGMRSAFPPYACCIFPQRRCGELRLEEIAHSLDFLDRAELRADQDLLEA